MKFPDFGWFDGFVVLFLICGLLLGRKRGMSAELLDLFQWLLIVVAAAHLHDPFGRFLARQFPVLSPLFWLVTSYILCSIGVAVVFMAVRSLLGGKLVGSDLFGRGEYYLGMVAGIIHFACILLVGLSLLNARLYTREELERRAAVQQENLGSITLPGPSDLQKAVFKESVTGRFARSYLENMLIKPTPSSSRALSEREGPARRREKLIDEVTGSPRR